MLNLGLIGEEFKNCHSHLLKHLEGNIAWRHPEDAIAQRERLKQERIAVREQVRATVSSQDEEQVTVSTENTKGTVSDSDGSFSEE